MYYNAADRHGRPAHGRGNGSWARRRGIVGGSAWRCNALQRVSLCHNERNHGIRVPQTAAQGTAAHPPTTIEDVFALVGEDFDCVDRLIGEQLSSGVALVEDIGRYIVGAGGKRLRPLIVLLTARACGYRGADHLPLATLIEFLHTATLLHDDVVDKSALRRGRVSANALWGNPASVLVGDFLYSRGFQLMVQLDRMAIMAIIADATNVIAEGEVMQLASIGNTAITEPEYFEVVRRKTAMLFQASAHTGATLCAEEPALIEALRRYGLHFGMAYQLVDDWLDYAGSSEQMGKAPGNDLAEGKVTLPLIHTLANGCPTDAEIVCAAIRARSAADFEQVAGAVRRSGGLRYTKARAVEEAGRAAAEALALPPSVYRDALAALPELAVARLG